MTKILPWGKIYEFIDKKPYTFKRGNWFTSPNARNNINGQVHQEVMAEFREFIDPQELLENYSKYHLEKSSQQRDTATIYDEPMDLVKAFIEEKNIVVGGRGDTLKIGHQWSSLEDVLIKIRNFTEVYNSQIPRDENNRPLANQFKPKYIEDVFQEHLIDMDLGYRHQVCDTLAYDGTDANTMVLELLDIMNISTDIPLSCEAMKHWLWLVKRRLLGRRVNDELMISLMAHQGVGKSYITRKLAEPLGDYYAESDLSSLADVREVGKWSKYFIVNFEELSKTNGSMAHGHFSSSTCETIKKILTQEEFVIRAMRSHKQFKHIRTFTGWATTNISIVDVLGDETGMRRFFQMESSQPAHEQFNHQRVADFDFLQLWRSIDENLARGYLHPESEQWDKLKEIQKTYIPKTQIDMWLSEGDFIAGTESDHNECLNLKDIYQYFLEFCGDANIQKNYTMGMKKFKEKIGDYLESNGSTSNPKYYLKEREQ